MRILHSLITFSRHKSKLNNFSLNGRKFNTFRLIVHFKYIFMYEHWRNCNARQIMLQNFKRKIKSRKYTFVDNLNNTRKTFMERRMPNKKSFKVPLCKFYSSISCFKMALVILENIFQNSQFSIQKILQIEPNPNWIVSGRLLAQNIALCPFYHFK